jgi:uncharacterized protein
MEPRFEWDPDKAEENRRKHGVSFEEASTVFRNPLASAVPDLEHSEHEERWVTIGTSSRGRLIRVVHVDTEEDAALTIRIISARRPDRRERNAYEQGE